MTPTQLKKKMAPMSARELAEKMGVSVRCVERWRSGRCPISPAMSKLIHIVCTKKNKA